MLQRQIILTLMILLLLAGGWLFMKKSFIKVATIKKEWLRFEDVKGHIMNDTIPGTKVVQRRVIPNYSYRTQSSYYLFFQSDSDVCLKLFYRFIYDQSFRRPPFQLKKSYDKPGIFSLKMIVDTSSQFTQYFSHIFQDASKSLAYYPIVLKVRNAHKSFFSGYKSPLENIERQILYNKKWISIDQPLEVICRGRGPKDTSSWYVKQCTAISILPLYKGDTIVPHRIIYGGQFPDSIFISNTFYAPYSTALINNETFQKDWKILINKRCNSIFYNL